MYILIALILFGILIAVHELGHFLTAKLLGVQVNEFSIGMGPALWKRQGRETLYSLRLLPIGGFCAMEGEDGGSDNPRAFFCAKPWKKLLILAAGSAANFLAGLLILTWMYVGSAMLFQPVIYGFMDGFPLEGEEYLLPGDEIVSIDGERVYMYSDISMLMSRGSGKTVDLVIRRDGQRLLRNDLPLVLREYTDENGMPVMRYGLLFSAQESSLAVRLKVSLLQSADFVRMVRLGLQDLISGRAGMQDLSGPIGIVGVMSDIGSQAPTLADAVESILYLGAFIAINLAVMNMLPLPALDGGRIFLLAAGELSQRLFHRRLSPQAEGYVHFAGLILLLALMVVVAISDIAKRLSGVM